MGVAKKVLVLFFTAEEPVINDGHVNMLCGGFLPKSELL